MPLDLREDAADGLADDQVGAPVVGGGRRVHEDEAPALVVVDEPGRRVDRQRRAAHDQHVRPRYGQDGPLQRRRVQSLAIEHDVRAHHGGARRAVGHAPGPGLVEVVDGGARAAPRALQPRPVPVELEHALGARGLVEAVDVLGDHRLQFPGALEAGEETVGGVRGDPLAGGLLGEPGVVGPGAGGEEVYGQHPFEGDLALLVVEALRAPEVGDPGLRRHPRAPEEHDVVRLGDPLRQRGRVVTHDGPLLTRCRLRQR